MTADEFKAWASKYGLSIEEAGAVLGTSRANAFKFANDSRPVSKSAYYNAEAIDLLSKEKSIKLIQKRLAQSQNETRIKLKARIAQANVLPIKSK